MGDKKYCSISYTTNEWGVSYFPQFLEEIGVRFLVTSQSTSTVVLGVFGNFGTKTDVTCYGLIRSFDSMFTAGSLVYQ